MPVDAVQRVRQDGKEPADEDDEDHPELDLVPDRSRVGQPEQLGQGLEFEYGNRKTAATRSGTGGRRISTIGSMVRRTGRSEPMSTPQRDAHDRRQYETDQHPQETDRRIAQERAGGVVLPQWVRELSEHPCHRREDPRPVQPDRRDLPDHKQHRAAAQASQILP